MNMFLTAKNCLFDVGLTIMFQVVYIQVDSP